MSPRSRLLQVFIPDFVPHIVRSISEQRSKRSKAANKEQSPSKGRRLLTQLTRFMQAVGQRTLLCWCYEGFQELSMYETLSSAVTISHLMEQFRLRSTSCGVYQKLSSASHRLAILDSGQCGDAAVMWLSELRFETVRWFKRRWQHIVAGAGDARPTGVRRCC